MSGQTGEAATRLAASGGLEVYLQLDAGESVILRTGAPPDGRSRSNYRRPSQSSAPMRGPWQVEPVGGGPELPAPFEIPALSSWTERGQAWERFAGTARYRIRFDAPAAGPWFLELGLVRESARARLNGRDIKTLFAPPHRMLLAELADRGNLLEIEGTNLAANRIRHLDRRGVLRRVFGGINFVKIDYKPFDASGWPGRESSLLGPVMLRIAIRIAPETRP